ncbi:hypothetical protein ABT001_26695 [Streptomyces sp. NPDC002793]
MRETGPEYLAGLLVLATGALTGTLVRTVRRRAADRRRPPESHPEENL